MSCSVNEIQLSSAFLHVLGQHSGHLLAFNKKAFKKFCFESWTFL